MNVKAITKALGMFSSLSDEDFDLVLKLHKLTEDERAMLMAVLEPQKSSKKATKKPGKKSQRASSLQQQVSAAMKVKADGNHRCIHLVNDEPCDTAPNDPIHDASFGYAGYHEFQSEEKATAASGATGAS